MNWMGIRRSICAGVFTVILGGTPLWCSTVLADQVEMLNGDRYVGRVLSLGNETLLLQSEVLGTLKLPRTRISTISLGIAAPEKSTNAIRVPSAALRSPNPGRLAVGSSTNTAPDLAATMRQLNGNSNLLQQVQQQLLSGAGPEAQAKFNDLVGSLMTGKLDMTGLRAQAKSTLAQARSARKEMGEEGGSMLDSYLSILDSFLQETEPSNAVTNAPVTASRPVSPKPEAEE
jgi:hypothetical protein